MEAQWHYAKDKQKFGPVSIDRLKELARSGELGPADMVWKEEIAGWILARQVRELFDCATSQPIMVPPAPPPLPSEGQEQLATSGPVVLSQNRSPEPPRVLVAPVVGMLVVLSFALLFAFLGLLVIADEADSSTVVLLALTLAHNLEALDFMTNIIRLRNYQTAQVAPWLVMTA
jgi:hypothetical protein